MQEGEWRSESRRRSEVAMDAARERDGIEREQHGGRKSRMKRSAERRTDSSMQFRLRGFHSSVAKLVVARQHRANLHHLRAIRIIPAQLSEGSHGCEC